MNMSERAVPSQQKTHALAKGFLLLSTLTLPAIPCGGAEPVVPQKPATGPATLPAGPSVSLNQIDRDLTDFKTVVEKDLRERLAKFNQLNQVTREKIENYKEQIHEIGKATDEIENRIDALIVEDFSNRKLMERVQRAIEENREKLRAVQGENAKIVEILGRHGVTLDRLEDELARRDHAYHQFARLREMGTRENRYGSVAERDQEFASRWNFIKGLGVDERRAHAIARHTMMQDSMWAHVRTHDYVVYETYGWRWVPAMP